ncbi:hypothetical protein ACJJTC_018549 [Scirpophaga incertulas]
MTMAERKRSAYWLYTEKMLLTAENLKAQWDSLKKNAKKVASAARQSLLKTGGGPANPKDDDPLHIKIMGLLSTSAVGLYNKFDSDSMAIIINNSETEESSTQNDAHDWGDYTPSMLQTPSSLRFDEKETVDEKIPAKNICKMPKAKEWSSKRRPAAPASTSMDEFYKKKQKH